MKEWYLFYHQDILCTALNSCLGLAVFHASNSEKNQVLIPVAICQERQQFLSIWRHTGRHSCIAIELLCHIDPLHA